MPKQESRKRHLAEQTLETVNNIPEPSYRTPVNPKSTLRNLTRSTVRTRQQTLTQIDFVTRIMPADQDENLEYDEIETPIAKKRRKTVHRELPHTRIVAPRTRKRNDLNIQASPGSERASKRTTRSSAAIQIPISEPDPPKSNEGQVYCGKASESRRNAKSTRLRGVKKESIDDRTVMKSPIGESTARNRQDAILSPTPATPPKILKKEIPSSQSPADSIRSTQSQKVQMIQHRSPLKDKSTNAQKFPTISPVRGKGVRWPPKLAVKDTFDESERDSSDISIQSVGLNRKDRSSSIVSIQSPSRPFGQHSFFPGNVPQCRFLELTDHYQRPASKYLPSAAQSETQDSDSEETRNLQIADTDLPENLHAVYKPNEAAFNPANRSAEMKHVTTASNLVMDNVATKPFQGSQIDNDLQIVQNSFRNKFTPPTVSKGNKRHLEAKPKPVSDSIRGLPTNILRPWIPPSFSPLPETDSPVNNKWGVPSLPLVSDSDEPSLPTRAPQLPTVLPTTPPPKPRVPSSQATTVDVTQPSPRPHHPHSPILIPSSQPNAPALPSSDKITKHARILAIPPPSSPFRAVAGNPIEMEDDGLESIDMDGTMLWDGRPLTDSQLLPPDLMDYIIPRPPGYELVEDLEYVKEEELEL